MCTAPLLIVSHLTSVMTLAPPPLRFDLSSTLVVTDRTAETRQALKVPRNHSQVVLDAASVPVTSGPVTLTASSPGDNGNITLQLANGTTLEPSGVLTGVSPQRADVAGTTVVQLALSFLPPDFAAANCSCYFLNASQVMDLERAAVQV